VPSDPVVTVRNLGKSYGDTVAVDGVSFDIRADEVFALVGPNGAGKTTTVEMLECLRTPDAGSVEVLGFDAATEAREVKERIGVVPQSFHTFDRLSVRENVGLVRRLYDDGAGVDETIERLALAEWADSRFGSLSGGLQRRTGIAMALVSDPDVLFLDEPTTGLDPAARRTTWTQIERLAAHGTTVVLTTHYMEEVEELADRAALMVDGSVEAVAPVPELVATYGGDAKVVVDAAEGGGRDDVEATLRDAAASVHENDAGDLVGVFDDHERAQSAFLAVRDAEGARSVQLADAGMEDVFLELAGGTVDATGDLR